MTSKIPAIRNTPLKKTQRGYVRQLGRTSTNTQTKVKFYLGHDMATAAQRRQWVEAIFVENARLTGGGDVWSELFLDLAKQIAKVGTAGYHVGEPFYFDGKTQDYSFVDRIRQAGVPQQRL